LPVHFHTLENEMKKTLMMMGACVALVMLSLLGMPAHAQPDPTERPTISAPAVVVAPATATAIAPCMATSQDGAAARTYCLQASQDVKAPAKPKPVKKDGGKKSKVLASGPGDEPDGGGDAGTPPGLRRLLT
jgi:hypothetical protein